MDETVNLTNVIQTTTDYGRFSLIHNNREMGRAHIEVLKDAIQRNPQLVEAQPILVNERFEVVDGQHRLTALQELGMPVHFTVVPGLTIADAREMNITHKGWGVDDFARSYALGGNTQYQRYLVLREDYPINHSVALIFCYREPDTKGIFASFRRGEFEMQDEAATRELLDKLMDAYERTDVRKIEFAEACLKMFQAAGYDHQHFLRKLEALGDTMLRNYSSRYDFLRALEDIYNYKLNEANRIRLF